MATIEEQIVQIEEEIKGTMYNKATQHHIGKLKAKMSRLREEQEKRRKGPSGGPKEGYAVRKSGNATVALVGFPSVGKSTLLNCFTGADSEIGAYEFTTLTVVPGLLEYRSAKIQILDLPGLISGASKGKGRGREVLSVVRSADMILLFVDIYQFEIQVLVNELATAGIRLNQSPVDAVLSLTERGGIEIHSTVEQTHLDEDTILGIVKEFGIVNGSLILRQNCDADRLIDFLAGNRIYLPSLVTLNKIDMGQENHLANIRKKLKGWKTVEISATNEEGIEELKEAIFNSLKFIRLYMRPQGGVPDYKEPLVVKEGSTVGMVCDTIRRDWKARFRYANVWGKSAKFPGQMIGINHQLKDEDVLTIVIRR